MLRLIEHYTFHSATGPSIFIANMFKQMDSSITREILHQLDNLDCQSVYKLQQSTNQLDRSSDSDTIKVR